MISAILRRIFRARPDPTPKFRQAIRDSVRGELDETFSVTREQLLKSTPEDDSVDSEDHAATVRVKGGRITAELFVKCVPDGWYRLTPLK